MDDFAIKYTNQTQVDALLTILTQWYELSNDWEATTYCGLQLTWDYARRTCITYIPGYIPKVLHRFQHVFKRPQDAPHPAKSPKLGQQYQNLAPNDTSPKLNEIRKNRVKTSVGLLLYYDQAVDNTLLKALNSISRKQAAPT